MTTVQNKIASAQIIPFPINNEKRVRNRVQGENVQEIANSFAEPSSDQQPVVIHDDAVISSRFNVMNDRPVEEKFFVKEYRIWDRYGEATFDREYFSSMDKSPDHLIFITALIHTQKLLYLVLSKHFGFEYSSSAKEHLKIWPTKVNVDLPRMVRDNRDVVQKLWIKEIKPVEGKKGIFNVTLRTSYQNTVEVDSEARIYLI